MASSWQKNTCDSQLNKKSRDIAQEAYSAANIFIKAKFKDSQDATAILSGPAGSIEDIQRLVEEAQARYVESSKDRKVVKWLRRVSARITYYGQVLDVLAQQHPEYLAIAWGTMKFIFMVSQRVFHQGAMYSRLEQRAAGMIYGSKAMGNVCVGCMTSLLLLLN
jgi:hypothetical protein